MPPTPSVVKTLFALSGNTCAYRGCEERLTDPAWKSVKARVAHIRGERPGSARFDSDMSDEERRAIENLILVCPNCHTLIDDLEPHKHSVDLLLQMKHDHESRALEGVTVRWYVDENLAVFAGMLLATQFGEVVGEPQDHEAAAYGEGTYGEGTYGGGTSPGTAFGQRFGRSIGTRRRRGD